jgi:3-hydroxypropanoate dehydrogenase
LSVADLTKAESLDEAALRRLFLDARTHNAWQDRAVSEALLRRLWDLARMPPTSANCGPLRVVFVTSAAAKEKLRPALMEGNRDKVMAAPVTAILAYDTRFTEWLPTLFPHTNARAWFEGNDALMHETAFRNGTLQGAYLMLAARALGLDCGPMSGFDKALVDAAFFPDGRFKSNVLCSLGYGDPKGLHRRNPRLDFDDACRVE